MGIFNFLFGKNKDKNRNLNAKKVQKNFSGRKKSKFYYTNSEKYGFGKIEVEYTGQLRIDIILIIAELDKIAQERKQDFNYKVLYSTLLDKGILPVPLVFSMGNQKYSVYVINNADNLYKYRDAVKHISRTAYPNLIYFSQMPVTESGKTLPAIEPLQLAYLNRKNNPENKGKFAMWWGNENEPYFHQSKTYEILKEMYELLRGYESYMLGYILRQLGITEELNRVKLPDKPSSLTVIGPEDKNIIIDFSQEKGIRFLFPVEKTSKEYREKFLNAMLVEFVLQLLILKNNNVEKDPEEEPNSYDWFTFMSKVVREKELKGEFKNHMIGLIEF